MSSYNYGHNTPDDTPSGKRQTEGDLLFWALVLISFVLCWPLGLFLLIRKLSDNKKKQTAAARSAQQTTVPPGWSAPGQQKAAPGRGGQAAQPVQSRPSMKKGVRWLLKIFGGFLAFVGLLATAAVFPAMIGSNGILWGMLPALLAVLSIFGAGALMLGKGIAMDKAARRYVKYLAAIGTLPSVSLLQISQITGFSLKRVEEDLDHMIEEGYFGPTAYLDLSLGYFFRSRTAAEEAAAKKRAEAATPKETEEGYTGVLRAIRRANDAIADPILSAKIDRLEEVTAQIFRIIEKDEKKAGQVRMFLEYYLPTTQKLLDSYAEFEAAGVDGQNLHMAKEKIEETMDNIVRGFENQLDALYAAEAMDIQSDIDVMNNMMQRDHAMHTSDFKVSTDAGPQLTLDPEGESAQAVQKEQH